MVRSVGLSCANNMAIFEKETLPLKEGHKQGEPGRNCKASFPAVRTFSPRLLLALYFGNLHLNSTMKLNLADGLAC